MVELSKCQTIQTPYFYWKPKSTLRRRFIPLEHWKWCYQHYCRCEGNGMGWAWMVSHLIRERNIESWLYHLSLSFVLMVKRLPLWNRSENGGMKGMDLMLYEHAAKKLTDSWVGDRYIAPTPDPVDKQDWTLVVSHKTNDNGYTRHALRCSTH